MKTTLSLLIFFLFFTLPSFGQTSPRLSKKVTFEYDSILDDYWVEQVSTYEYNSLGKLSTEIRKAYNKEGELISWFGLFHIYDNNNNLIKRTGREYNENVNLWVTSSWEEYTYNTNGCEVSYSFIINAGAFSGEFQRIEYERNVDCQIIKRTFWQQDFGNNSSELLLNEIEERTYFQDEISYENKIFVPRDTSTDLFLYKEGIYHLNPFGNQVESLIVTYYLDTNGDLVFYEKRSVANFDLNENLTSSFFYFRESDEIDWMTISHYTYENEYDEQNRIIDKTLNNSLSHTDEFIRHESFDYLCEQDLEPIKSSWTSNNGLIRKYDYFYEGENDCFEIEEALLEISIFPNPSSGIINIDSPILQSGDTQIKVLDINGKLLLEKVEIQRQEIQLDLSDLPNGMYVIQLMNQEHFVQEKVMVMN